MFESRDNSLGSLSITHPKTQSKVGWDLLKVCLKVCLENFLGIISLRWAHRHP